MIIKKRDNAAGPDSELLQSGRRYTVYAILLGSPIQFLVYEEQALSFPFFVSSEELELVDARLSKYWRYSASLPSTEMYSSCLPLLAFPEMVEDRLFYQELVDGNEDAKRVWQHVKHQMDVEADALEVDCKTES